MKEEKYTCDICHEEHDVSELTYFDESYLCEDCLRRETFICRDCGDRHWNDDSADGDGNERDAHQESGGLRPAGQGQGRMGHRPGRRGGRPV